MAEKKYKLVYRKSECIGAGACESAAPHLWFFDKETSIATLKDPETQKTDEKEILFFAEENFEKHLEAAQVCPVMIIELYDAETGVRIYPQD